MIDVLMTYDKKEAVCCIDKYLGGGCLLFFVVVMPVTEIYSRGENVSLLILQYIPARQPVNT
jgi:hypothetical protein